MSLQSITVEGVCVSTPLTRVAKTPLPQVQVEQTGLAGDRHAGEMRASPRTGQPIPNRRQWSAVSTDEVEAFCRELDVMPFPVGALGENIRLAGVNLGEVSPGTVLEFPSGCRLVITGQNDPCEKAAAELGASYGPLVERLFVRTAFGHRGVVGTVLTPGLIRAGDSVRLEAPEQAGASEPQGAERR
jgi:MOSC domain-containing protein YiiM